MTKRIRISICPLAILGVLLTLSISCKKDETSSKKDPVISWTNPSDISFSTLLSTTQLNATTDVPGTFIYTPAIDTKLNVGANQNLKVDFTPTDAATYNTANKTVKINVTPLNISNTTWDATLIHSTTYQWHADVTFNANGTTKYDEPSSPGVYLTYGTWTLTGDKIHFGIGLDPAYIFDGIIIGNNMNGTYTFGTDTKTWSALKRQ